MSGSEATPVTAHPPTHALTGLATAGIYVPKLETQFIFSDSNTGLRAVLLSLRLTAGTPKDGERWLGAGVGAAGLVGPQVPRGWILIAWKLFFPPTLLLQLVRTTTTSFLS